MNEPDLLVKKRGRAWLSLTAPHLLYRPRPAGCYTFRRTVRSPQLWADEYGTGELAGAAELRVDVRSYVAEQVRLSAAAKDDLGLITNVVMA